MALRSFADANRLAGSIKGMWSLGARIYMKMNYCSVWKFLLQLNTLEVFFFFFSLLLIIGGIKGLFFSNSTAMLEPPVLAR